MGSERVDDGSAAAKVLAAAADGVVDLIARHNGDIDSIFGTAGLEIREIDSPFNEINLSQYCALFEEAAARTGNDNFGLSFGQRFEPRRLGAIGRLAVHSPTMAAAIGNFVRYFPAHQDHSILTLEDDGGLMWLHYQIIHPRIGRRRQDAELSLGMFCNIFWHGLGPGWQPMEIHFEHPRSDGHVEHETCFRAPVRFGQRSNSIAFCKRDLDAVMPTSDPYLLSVIERFLVERQALRSEPEDLVGALRARIRIRLGGKAPTLSEFGKEFGVSARTMQRRLRDCGVSFHDLLRGARRELALSYVRDTDIALTDVALALGYSEHSAFTRAFRAWTGLSPQRYRSRSRCPHSGAP